MNSRLVLIAVIFSLAIVCQSAEAPTSNELTEVGIAEHETHELAEQKLQGASRRIHWPPIPPSPLPTRVILVDRPMLLVVVATNPNATIVVIHNPKTQVTLVQDPMM